MDFQDSHFQDFLVFERVFQSGFGPSGVLGQLMPPGMGQLPGHALHGAISSPESGNWPASREPHAGALPAPASPRHGYPAR